MGERADADGVDAELGERGDALLIDAARFLRDLAEDNPIVRRKFNEPDATLGIPGARSL